MGPAGANGKAGAKGERGVQGPPGQKGERGESGASGAPCVMAFKNWKECAWKNINDDKDNGLIKVSNRLSFWQQRRHVYIVGRQSLKKAKHMCTSFPGRGHFS